jgi:hypothetical protein
MILPSLQFLPASVSLGAYDILQDANLLGRQVDSVGRRGWYLASGRYWYPVSIYTFPR